MFCFCDRLNHSIIPHFPDNNQTQTMPTFEVVKKLVLLQAHIRGAIERVAFHDTLMCEMQDILESQDPELEEQYDLLDAFCNRVYASY